MVGIEKYKEQDEKLYQAVAQAQAGRVESINLIYELSKKYIYKIIFDIVKNNEDTEDLLQDTYMQIFNNLHTLENPRAFHVWAGKMRRI